LYAAHRYPPKLVLSLAAKYARGTEFDRSQFTGGEDSSAFRLLRSLSFEIVPKAVLPDILKRFLTQASTGSALAVSGYPTEYRGLQVKVSFGKGVLARVPWIAFLGAGHVPTKGSYPVLLYYRKAGYVVVAYGISETHDTAPLWRNLDSTSTIEQYLATQAAVEPERYGDSDYVFIIDEINRGNLSKVFGELMMLIEADKRDPAWGVPLAVSCGRWHCTFRHKI